jgi:hypothetical protein
VAPLCHYIFNYVSLHELLLNRQLVVVGRERKVCFRVNLMVSATSTPHRYFCMRYSSQKLLNFSGSYVAFFVSSVCLSYSFGFQSLQILFDLKEFN